MSTIWTDLRSVVQNAIDGQERELLEPLSSMLEVGQGKGYSFSTTGHSLGGWLAQITVFLAEAQNFEEHVKAISFDSPGARLMLERLNPKINPVLIDQLDITIYLSSPNLVNACNRHVGTVYRVVFEQLKYTTRNSYLLKSHAMETLVRAFNPATGDAYKALLVNSWPKVSKKLLKWAKRFSKATMSLNLVDSFLTMNLLACQFADKISRNEAMGEYSAFFAFAKKCDHYHPEPSYKFDRFDCTYACHYNAIHCDYRKIHMRHIPKHVRRFLERLYNTRDEYCLGEIRRDQLLQVLENMSWDIHTGWLNITYPADLRLVVDRLLFLLEKGSSSEAIFPLIQNALGDSDWRVRRAAVATLPPLLEKGGSTEIFPLIQKGLGDSSYNVRRAAVEALPLLLEKGVNSAAIFSLIQKRLGDSDNDVRRAAVEALPLLLEKGVNSAEIFLLIQNALSDSDNDVRSAAVASLPILLEKGGSAAIFSLIQKRLGDSDNDVRRAAFAALPILL
ncbi:MAG: HEAT repeat domain-containing protein, partial [Bacteroidota bacterium]